MHWNSNVHCKQVCAAFLSIVYILPLEMQLLKGEDHISGVMVSVIVSSAVGVGSSPYRVKPKTIELVFVAFPLSTQCPSGATRLLYY